MSSLLLHLLVWAVPAAGTHELLTLIPTVIPDCALLSCLLAVPHIAFAVQFNS